MNIACTCAETRSISYDYQLHYLKIRGLILQLFYSIIKRDFIFFENQLKELENSLKILHFLDLVNHFY